MLRSQMNSSTKHYICGFNGFKQIDQCREQVILPCASKEIANDCFFSVPQQITTQVKLCTWSNIFGILGTADDRLTCYGYNSSQVSSNLHHHGKEKSSSETVINVGKDVLIQDNCLTTCMVIEDDAKLCKLSFNKDHVTLLDGTKDLVYGIKDEEILEGEILRDSEYPCSVRLNFSVLTNNLSVKMVSCGYEHTLLLTRGGSVFSHGSGSRGQLGHGEVTVDLNKTPRHVETLSGISVVTIAAGGWHSTSVTDTGDVYVWGWNESGQLGLPNGTQPCNEPCDDHSSPYHSEKGKLCDFKHDTELEKYHYYSYVEETTDSAKSEIGDEGKCSEMHSYGRQTRESGQEMDEKVDCAEVSDGLVETKGTIECNKTITYENSVDLNKESNEKEVYSERKRNLPSCVSFKEGCVSQKYYQSIESVQVQTVPYGLDFPDDLNVKTVSCGTRHSCLLSDTGILLTSGWNAYGQLCHGDTKSRDYFEMVTQFNQKELIIDVKAQSWNTYIVTDNNCGKRRVSKFL